MYFQEQIHKQKMWFKDLDLISIPFRLNYMETEEDSVNVFSKVTTDTEKLLV